MKEIRTTFPIKAKYPEVVTDCKSWKEGEQKNPRGMLFFIRTYHCEDVIKAFLGSVYVDAYSYIYHDEDTYPDGKPKEPHYHLLVKLSAQVSLTAIVKAFQGQQTYVQLPYSLPHAYRYLVHADNPDKHQYPADERVEYNAKSLQLTAEEQAEDKNRAFLEDLENKLPRRDMAIKYGRDYMKNVERYEQFAGYVERDKIQDSFATLVSRLMCTGDDVACVAGDVALALEYCAKHKIIHVDRFFDVVLMFHGNRRHIPDQYKYADLNDNAGWINPDMSGSWANTELELDRARERAIKRTAELAEKIKEGLKK